MPVNNRIAANAAEFTAWRRDLHSYPELGFEEHRTSDIVASKLASWGIEVTRGIAGTGGGHAQAWHFRARHRHSRRYGCVGDDGSQ